MSYPAKRVPGYDYLYERGRRFTVRVQVPRHLKTVLGKGEFKKSVGGDLADVKRRYHNVVAAFFAQIDAARVIVVPAQTRSIRGTQPTVEDVDVACYAHFKRMAVAMKGKVAQPVGDNPRDLQNRTEGYRVMIENQVAVYTSCPMKARIRLHSPTRARQAGLKARTRLLIPRRLHRTGWRARKSSTSARPTSFAGGSDNSPTSALASPSATGADV